ncbi:N-alpha-acetyltransferase 38, NatC auxiliary subunit [Oryzias melastigma]|uniref:N-alpha-acetyltransferase 38, NatC auxiliary subunit n=1 Tax=Oryzias melastigma TaxID=30732 RepID=A0A834F873_ORYME|nr:N-alpha-acetyltransferase 38, NatC auxiliary subunit [Oryzias melastigma]
MRIRMTDGRTLVGLFLCTDRDCNVILGSAQEFLKSPDTVLPGRAQSSRSGHDPRAPRGLHRGGGRQSRRRSWIWSHLLRKPWTFETSIPIMLRWPVGQPETFGPPCGWIYEHRPFGFRRSIKD